MEITNQKWIQINVIQELIHPNIDEGDLFMNIYIDAIRIYVFQALKILKCHSRV